jgi:ABC-type uncharacterized transport system permease subunit
MGVSRNIMMAMTLSGALCGMAGANEVLGVNRVLAMAFSSGYGFDSIALALLGNNQPLGVVLAALLFGTLRNGATRMQVVSGIPIDIISILQAVILALIAAPAIIRAIYRLRAFASAFLGGVQLMRARGFGRYTNMVLAAVTGFFIFGFLTWAAAGSSLNLASLLNTTISKAVPLTLGALSGVLCERAGVVNIAIEGMMLAGALVAAVVGSLAGSLWVGLLAAVLAGAFLGFIHAVLSIKYLVNQIVSGTVINIFSIGMTSYIASKFLTVNRSLNAPGIFPVVEVPVLSKIPFLGVRFCSTTICLCTPCSSF